MAYQYRFLWIDGEAAGQELILAQLRHAYPDVRVDRVVDAYGLGRALENSRYDLVIANSQPGWTDGLTLLGMVKARDPECPVVLYATSAGEHGAAEVMRGGADDFVVISAESTDRLILAVGSALRSAQQRKVLKETEQALQQSTDRLKIFRQIDHAILAAQSLELIAKEALQILGRLIPYQWANFVVYDLQVGEAREVAFHADGETHLGSRVAIPLEEMAVDRDLREGRRQLFQELEALRVRPAELERLLDRSIRSYLSTPIMASGELIATLSLGMSRPGAITPEHIELAGEAADSLAIAMQNAQLFDAERSRRQEAETLREITTALASTLDLDQVLEDLLTQLDQVVPFDSACVFLLEQDDLRAVAGRGFSDEGILRQRFPADDPLFEEIQRSKAPLVVADAAQVPEFRHWGGTGSTRGWMGVPLMVGGQVIGCLTLNNRSVGAYNHSQASLAQAFANQAAVAIQNAQLFEQIRAGRERLRALSHRLVEVQEAQMRNIARELHDQIGQVLTGLKLILEMSARSPKDGLEANINEALGLVNELMTRVRELSLDLRPAMLDDLGLLPALLWHFERYTTQTRLQVDFKHTGIEDRRFKPEIETAAYRIIQEALTNVARHAGVDEVLVRIWADENLLGLQIEDRGRGFDADAELAAGESSGLTGMLERAVLLGGRFSIESEQGFGTLLTAELPVRGRIERRRRERP